MKNARISIDVETIRADASKFTSLRDLYRDADHIVRAAKRFGIFDEITAGMDRGKKRDGYWTEETIREAALQCKTRTEFRQRFRRASTLAYEGGKYEEITAHMVSRAAKRKPAGYWTLEKLREAAASCTSIHELMIKYPSVQTKAIALGIYDEITAHIPRKLADAYTLQTALVKAKQYSSIAEFKTQNQSAYNAVRRFDGLNQLREIFPESQTPFGFWTLEKCMTAAAKFETIVDFRAKEPVAYTVTKKNNWLDQVAKQLERARMPNGWWDDLSNFLERLNACETLADYNNSNMPFAARRNGWMEHVNTVLPSLIRGATGFDTTKPAIMYYLRIETVYAKAYKIGITNRSVQQRFYSEDRDKITVLNEWEYDVGLDAFNAEQEILEAHAEHTWMGEPLLRNGNTEMFSSDVLGLDKQN
jgi:hypothetical protein